MGISTSISLRADIVARIRPVTHFIVSSADPGCRKAMAAVPSSVTQGYAAAKAREATKKVHYSKVTTPARLPAGLVIPFVIETQYNVHASNTIELIEPNILNVVHASDIAYVRMYAILVLYSTEI